LAISWSLIILFAANENAAQKILEMHQSKHNKGFSFSFDYTEDALQKIDRFFKSDHAIIIPLTVQEILDEHIARKLA
jgi:hypothetical protein